MGYYEKHHKTYFERTAWIDPAPFLTPFLDCLPAGAAILDVGCGSGRDLLWFKKKGFAATGFERSPGLAALAREHSGCPVIEGDFTDFDFSGLAFDALLLCGALVHLSPAAFPGVLVNILGALNRPGWVFLSLKSGRGRRRDAQGRTFYTWQTATLERRLAETGLRIIAFSCSPSAVGTGEQWLGYVLGMGNREWGIGNRE